MHFNTYYTSSSASPVVSLYLNKNRNKSIRKVSDKTLFSSGSSKSVNYYYIDLKNLMKLKL